MFTTLAPQVGKVTYVEAMDAALRIESGLTEKIVFREPTKKPKV